jgi:hypothetical protein
VAVPCKRSVPSATNERENLVAHALERRLIVGVDVQAQQRLSV